MEEYLVPLVTPCVYYCPNVVSTTEAEEYYTTLKKEVPWTKTSKINRWVALYEENDANDYKYRDAPGQQTSQPFSDAILFIKQKVEELYEKHTGTKVEFNTCLANFYENGEQRIGWHTDREEIGRTTPIASVSLGATRSFLLRHQINGVSDRASVDLESGSVVFMENICQKEYLHSIPRQTEITEGRINLTFRCKTEHTPGEEEHERRDRWLQNISNTNIEEENGSMLNLQSSHHGIKFFGDDAKTDFSSDNPTVLYTCRCNIGMECHLAAELSELLHDEEQTYEIVARPWGIAGYVAVVAESSTSTIESQKHLVAKLFQLRSALYVMEYHDHFSLDDVPPSVPSMEEGEGEKKKKKSSEPVVDGEALYQFYKKRLESNQTQIPDIANATTKTTFRVTSERIGGGHQFRSPDVEYEIGGALSEFYTSSQPKMQDYDINVRVDVICDHVIVGTQLNVVDLSLRQKQLPYRNSVTLKTNLAYVMLRLANIEKKSTNDGSFLLVDPFCGAGTILLEAMDITGGVGMRTVGMDVSRRALNGAAENARTLGYNEDTCSFHCCDARGIRRHVEVDTADAVVSNLPWGVRTGQNQGVQDLQQMYEVFLRTSWYCLKPGGRVVMLVLRGLQMMRILRKLAGRYAILKIFVVRTSNNLPCIVVAEKLVEDTMHESIKQQLNYMSSFINISTEMYHAINMEEIEDKNE